MKLKYILLTLAAAVVLASCKKEPETPKLNVDTLSLSFDVEGGAQTVGLACNKDWTATASESWITVPSSGSKSTMTTSVTITVARNTGEDRTGTVTFAIEGRSATINISQKGIIPEDQLPDNAFQESFSSSQGRFTIDEKSNTAGAAIWQFSSDFKCMKATAYVNGTDHASESWLISPEIDLTWRKTIYLNFDHAAQYFNDLQRQALVKVTADDGKTWNDVKVPNYPPNTDWNFINSGDIDLAAYAGKKIKIAFVYISTAQKAGTWEIKNVKVTRIAAKALDNGDTYKSVPKWMELPAVTGDNQFVIHTVLENGKYYRNFSLSYNKDAHEAEWVAYPLNDWYTSGPRSDSWAYDPFIDSAFQPDLSSGYSASGYDRGHQIPSADRARSLAFNSQTFYYSNITPQNHEFNGGLWAKLEEKVRKWSSSSTKRENSMVYYIDTLYVVTGCILPASGGKSVTDKANKVQVIVPDGYFKALLKYSSSGTTNGGYMAAGIWLENRNYTEANTDMLLKQKMVSIEELEKKTGLKFFTNLEEKVSATVAKRIKSEKPQDNKFWFN